jgi:hypothetical protein
MKLSIPYLLLFAVLSGLFVGGCIKKPEYPSEPVIGYSDFLRHGDPADPDSIEVVITFTDNEGDIGFTEVDTHGIFKRGNIFMYDSYWKDTVGGGHWVLFDDSISTAQIDTHFINYRVPPILPEGDPEEPVKGLILIKQRPFVMIFPKIKYTIYMYDQARHRSNTIETPAIEF